MRKETIVPLIKICRKFEGCNVSQLSQWISEFSKVFAIDINPSRYENIEKSGIGIIKMDIEKDEKLIKDEFDIVYFSVYVAVK